MSYARTTILTASMISLVSSSTLAIGLATGGVVFPGGETAAMDPNQAGIVQNDDLIQFRMDAFPVTPFSDMGGMVQNRVVESNNLNTLIFSPRIRDTFNIDSGRFEIVAFQLQGYTGWQTDVDFRTDGVGDLGPTSVSRSADGDLLTFRYDDALSIDAIAPGLQEESLFPTILTDATEYALTGSMTIFGYDSLTPSNLISVSIGGLAVPVPEPASVGLIGSGLACVWGRRKRRLLAKVN